MSEQSKSKPTSPPAAIDKPSYQEVSEVKYMLRQARVQAVPDLTQAQLGLTLECLDRLLVYINHLEFQAYDRELDRDKIRTKLAQVDHLLIEREKDHERELGRVKNELKEVYQKLRAQDQAVAEALTKTTRHYERNLYALNEQLGCESRQLAVTRDNFVNWMSAIERRLTSAFGKNTAQQFMARPATLTFHKGPVPENPDARPGEVIGVAPLPDDWLGSPPAQIWPLHLPPSPPDRAEEMEERVRWYWDKNVRIEATPEFHNQVMAVPVPFDYKTDPDHERHPDGSVTIKGPVYLNVPRAVKVDKLEDCLEVPPGQQRLRSPYHDGPATPADLAAIDDELAGRPPADADDSGVDPATDPYNLTGPDLIDES
jgi:hypothetical protein